MTSRYDAMSTVCGPRTELSGSALKSFSGLPSYLLISAVPRSRADARGPFMSPPCGVGDWAVQPQVALMRSTSRAAQVARSTLCTVSYTHLRAHETRHDLVCRLLLEKK